MCVCVCVCVCVCALLQDCSILLWDLSCVVLTAGCEVVVMEEEMKGERSCFAAAAIVVIVAAAAAATVTTGQEGVIDIDGDGTMQINSSDPHTQPVLLNGLDVLSIIRQEQSINAEQSRLIAHQAHELSLLKNQVCSQRHANLDKIPGAGAGTNAWAGGVLAPNGLIYGVPYHATSVLVIDPASNTLDTTTIAGLPVAQHKWHAAVLVPASHTTGNSSAVYCFPNSHDSVLILRPATNTTDWSTIADVGSDGHKFRGGVLANNGLIYGIPFSATFVLIIDPRTNTINTTAMNGLPNREGKWWGGAVVPDGRIFGIPHDADAILIINPDTNTLDITSLAGFGLGGAKWAGGVLSSSSSDDCIFGIPRNSESVLTINSEAMTTDATTVSGLVGEKKWAGGVLAANGKVVGLPYNSDSVLVVDPFASADAATAITGAGTENFKHRGGVLAPNGKVYSIPNSADHVLVIDVGC